MNDTEILDRIIEILKPENTWRSDIPAKGRDQLVQWIEAQRAEEKLNEKIRKEVAAQIKKAKGVTAFDEFVLKRSGKCTEL